MIGEESIRAVVPSHARYLKGMETSDSPKGMLPRYSSWSLLRTGAFGSYSELKGIEQPGFINRANFLLRWDISPSCRGFIGYEYETTRGARFFMQTPSKVVQGGSSALSAKVLLEHEFMPLFVLVPTAAGVGGIGRGGSGGSGASARQSGSIGQLMRIWFALPADCVETFVITPLVTPGRNAPTFKTTPDEIPLTKNQISILRLPYVYMDENRVYHPPKEMTDFVHFKVHKAIKTQKG